MEQKNQVDGMLELLLRPAFYVQDGIIVQTNRGAQQLFIQPNDPIGPMIASGKEEYEAFECGCLHLSLRISGQIFGASVTQGTDGHIFTLEPASTQPELQCIALAAQELREPLAGMMAATNRLMQDAEQSSNTATKDSAAQVNRRMFQLLRIIGNMSDAQQYAQRSESHQEYRNIAALFRDLFSSAVSLAEQAGYHLEFTGPEEAIYTMVDKDMLERAIYNLISNAMKFSPAGSAIRASLVVSDKKLRFSIEDSGSGVGNSIQSTVFTRYLRMPALEDSRHGLGLGMVLVRYAAFAHGGAVLMDQPHGQGTRVTLTLAIRHGHGDRLQSPILRVDYTGEYNHGLVELSDVLPAYLYENETLP